MRGDETDSPCNSGDQITATAVTCPFSYLGPRILESLPTSLASDSQ
jgi:hypothetical protein